MIQLIEECNGSQGARTVQYITYSEGCNPVRATAQITLKIELLPGELPAAASRARSLPAACSDHGPAAFPAGSEHLAPPRDSTPEGPTWKWRRLPLG
jgi:hypothetical protein